jgi:hypothetical protein
MSRANRGILLLLIALLIFGALSAAMIRQYSWLQSAYFVVAALELILVFLQIGIVPSQAEADELSR